MNTFSPGHPAAHSIPFHPSLLGEDEAIEGVAAAKRYFAKAYEFQSKGNLMEAVHNYRNAIVACPNMFEAYFNIGLCFEHRRDTLSAIQAFEQAARLMHGFKPIYQHLAYLYGLIGDPDTARFYESTYRKL
jgi:tetratricopeptide (TPR) repeat protein